MPSTKIEAETVQAFGRTFVKGNVPEINATRCMACGNCVRLCRKLGPDVLEIVSSQNLRNEIGLSDGDVLCLTVLPA